MEFEGLVPRAHIDAHQSSDERTTVFEHLGDSIAVAGNVAALRIASDATALVVAQTDDDHRKAESLAPTHGGGDVPDLSSKPAQWADPAICLQGDNCDGP
jgi:hypothetical protein